MLEIFKYWGRSSKEIEAIKQNKTKTEFPFTLHFTMHYRKLDKLCLLTFKDQQKCLSPVCLCVKESLKRQSYRLVLMEIFSGSAFGTNRCPFLYHLVCFFFIFHFVCGLCHLLSISWQLRRKLCLASPLLSLTTLTLGFCTFGLLLAAAWASRALDRPIIKRNKNTRDDIFCA